MLKAISTLLAHNEFFCSGQYKRTAPLAKISVLYPKSNLLWDTNLYIILQNAVKSTALKFVYDLFRRKA